MGALSLASLPTFSLSPAAPPTRTLPEDPTSFLRSILPATPSSRFNHTSLLQPPTTPPLLSPPRIHAHFAPVLSVRPVKVSQNESPSSPRTSRHSSTDFFKRPVTTASGFVFPVVSRGSSPGGGGGQVCPSRLERGRDSPEPPCGGESGTLHRSSSRLSKGLATVNRYSFHSPFSVLR